MEDIVKNSSIAFIKERWNTLNDKGTCCGSYVCGDCPVLEDCKQEGEKRKTHYNSAYHQMKTMIFKRYLKRVEVIQAWKTL